MNKRAIWLSVTYAAGLACLASAVHGQAYPNRPIRIIVPYAAGGGADVLARTLAPRLTERLGQQVIVENRPGGNTIIGTEATARSKPDGYTMGLVTITHAVNAAMGKKLPYDSLDDFVPVMEIYAQPLIVVTHPSVPVRTVRQLIELARAKPGQLSFASSGEGGAPHLGGELFKQLAKVDMVHVPYKGAGPASIDVVGGHVPLMFGPVVTVVPHIKSKRLNALAASTPRRIQTMPDLPTVAESGVPGYDISSWTGVLFPAGTPQDIVVRMNAELRRILDTPATRDVLTAEGSEIVGGSPADFGRFLREEIGKWSSVLTKQP